MKTRYTIFAAIAIAGIIIDQLTKIAIDRSMRLFDSIPLIENFFNITYVRNKGAAFSFLSNASWRLPFFITVSIVAALVILVAFRKLLQIGASLLVIEHNLDVIKTADWIIDLGPEGGHKGGTIVTYGPPEEVAKVQESYTGRYLRTVLCR